MQKIKSVNFRGETIEPSFEIIVDTQPNQENIVNNNLIILEALKPKEEKSPIKATANSDLNRLKKKSMLLSRKLKNPLKNKFEVIVSCKDRKVLIAMIAEHFFAISAVFLIYFA